jgi:phosphopantothenoylcysteine decarboxylase/phosphopantothenate--cysteine ligase
MGIPSWNLNPETADILEKIKSLFLEKKKSNLLHGKQVVVTAGPTREFLDPVRFISNPSSGKMGVAMANAAKQLGANVTLLHGPVSVKIPERMESESFTSAAELFSLVKKHQNADIFILAAAVSDFSPTSVSESKIKKESADKRIELKENPDSLKWLGENKRDDQILIGFAMETEKLEENATKKLNQKNADWILANNLADKNSGFESDTNQLLLIGKKIKKEFSGTKPAIAEDILNFIFSQ